MFFDYKFEEKLDTNCNLIGFENGVYDLENKLFRNGIPNDFISLSTNLPFSKFLELSDNIPYFKKILDFFELVLPNDEIRNDFLQVLSSCLSGESKDEKLYILTGSNSKTLIMNLITPALGDYCTSCPITYMTRKRVSSNEISSEQLKMKGKRLGFFHEIDESNSINLDIIREFISSPSKILVRDLFGNANEMIEYKQQMKKI